MNSVLSKIRYSDFDVSKIETYKMTFDDNNIVDYSQIPRRKNLLHLLIGGRRLYEFNGKIFSVESGTLIFIPHNTQYVTTAVSYNDEKCVGIGICFDANIPFCENELNIYCTQVLAQKEIVLNLFQNIYDIQKRSPLELLEVKSAFYKLLSFLTGHTLILSSDYRKIKAAVDFINVHFRENLPVKHYADVCNLSESFFRKRFCEYFGKSPIDYRNQLRFIEAKKMYQKNYTTQEIAEQLGFCDSGYMLKLYKKKMGRTLKADSKII